jgi:general secretion pathway protein M
MKQAWQRLSRREQRLLQMLGGFLLVVLAFALIWQPTRQRLEVVERHYQRQMSLAVQLQMALPRSHVVVPDQPLTLRISESLNSTGLEIRQMEAEGELLRLSLEGDAHTLMTWIDGVERSAVALQSLTLEKRDKVLQAQMVLR